MVVVVVVPAKQWDRPVTRKRLNAHTHTLSYSWVYTHPTPRTRSDDDDEINKLVAAALRCATP